MNKHFLSKKLLGKYVNLREITLDDAQFVLDLRCNGNKSKFLHKTENNLSGNNLKSGYFSINKADTPDTIADEQLVPVYDSRSEGIYTNPLHIILGFSGPVSSKYDEAKSSAELLSLHCPIPKIL